MNPLRFLRKAVSESFCMNRHSCEAAAKHACVHAEQTLLLTSPQGPQLITPCPISTSLSALHLDNCLQAPCRLNCGSSAGHNLHGSDVPSSSGQELHAALPHLHTPWHQHNTLVVAKQPPHALPGDWPYAIPPVYVTNQWSTEALPVHRKQRQQQEQEQQQPMVSG
jgi:hypothetical protein